MLADLVEHHDDRRIAAERANELQPVFGLGVFLALPTVEDQKIETAGGEEELMGGVHDFLAAEIPDVQGDRVFAAP